MRTITLLIVHCSATPQGVTLSFEDCRRDHILHRGFRDIGYHFYLTREARFTEAARWKKPVRIASITTATLSASAMKEDWMLQVVLPIPAHGNRRLRYWHCYVS